MSVANTLVHDAAALGAAISPADAARLEQLLAELARWNRTYNLTAIRGHEEMLTHHVLDSLSIHPELSGATVADVGTGAGFPGLPLAIVNPARRFTLIDSSGKKIRFVQHAARMLGLTNVEGVQARVEGMGGSRQFDTIVARAFAPLDKLVEGVADLCGADTRVLAMKGKWPREELGSLPLGWSHEGSRELRVPGLNAARCVIVLKRGTPSADGGAGQRGQW